jgi:hypothetical protein
MESITLRLHDQLRKLYRHHTLPDYSDLKALHNLHDYCKKGRVRLSSSVNINTRHAMQMKFKHVEG